jgi:hypothetical protein
MKIKNQILKKLGFRSEPETRNAKPQTQSGTSEGAPEQPPPPHDSPAETPTAVDLGENASDLEDRVNRQSKIVNEPEPSKHASTYITRPSTLDWRNATTNRSPRGKVAHLPPAVREQVCNWISEGVTLQQIAKNLADLGHPGFNHQNISNWKENGYRTWVRHQEEVDRARLRAEDSLCFAHDPAYSDALLAGAEVRAANALEDAYASLHPTSGSETLLRQARMIELHVRAFERLNQQRLRCRKLKLDDEFRREKLNPSKKEQSQENKAPLSDEAQPADKALAINVGRRAAQPVQISESRKAVEKIKSDASLNGHSTLDMPYSEQASASLCKVPAQDYVSHPSPRSPQLETPPVTSAHLGAPPAGAHHSHSSYPSYSEAAPANPSIHGDDETTGEVRHSLSPGGVRGRNLLSNLPINRG